MSIKKLFLYIFSFLFLITTSFAQTTYVYYTVKKGDSLYKISRRFHVSIRWLKKVNHLRTSIIHPGELLRVGVRYKPLVEDPFFKYLLNSPIYKSYRVKHRESLGRIAKKFGVSLLGLKNFNRLSTYYVLPGTVLKIPIRPKKSKDLDFFRKFDFCHRTQRIFYRVKRGDSLYKIARRFHTSVKRLKKLNHLKSSLIRPHQRLLVKVSKLRTKCEEYAGYIIHTVEKGETLLKLSEEYHVPIQVIKRFNHLYTNKIVVGETIKIPITSKDEEIYKKYSEFCLNSFELSPFEEKVLSEKLKEVANRFRRYRYKFGGNGNGCLDCSMFVKLVYDRFGIDLPRTARKQFILGEKVYKSQLMPGDLVFFITRGRYPSHVGIYLGDGKFMHFSPSRKGLAVDRLDSPYFKRHYLGAKRVFTKDFFTFFRSFITETASKQQKVSKEGSKTNSQGETS